MNITREFLKYVRDNTAFGVGTDLFQGRLPDTNTNGIIMYHSGGAENESNMQSYMIFANSHYDDFDTANDNLVVVYNLLSFSNGLTLDSGDYVYNIVPVKLPGFVTVTEQNKYVFSCSLMCFITRP